MKLLSILVFLASCGTTTHTTPSSDTIRVKVNEHFDIKLDTRLGTGFSWVLADSAWRSNLSLDTTYVVNDPQQRDNGQEVQVFRFKALAKSESTLHFNYVRPWKKEEAPDKQRSFTIIVN